MAKTVRLFSAKTLSTNMIICCVIIAMEIKTTFSCNRATILLSARIIKQLDRLFSNKNPHIEKEDVSSKTDSKYLLHLTLVVFQTQENIFYAFPLYSVLLHKLPIMACLT